MTTEDTIERRITAVIEYHFRATDQWQRDFSRQLYLKLIANKRMEEQ
ncbi:hypothetical protein [Schleiferilactobacillus harbinensis]|nr:hypothetical protein [Schleiferilactobacillus harbinensis]GEK06124.1 hypothetical protein LHA01_13630 [Schleiferilactobacillus harbinensis]